MGSSRKYRLTCTLGIAAIASSLTIGGMAFADSSQSNAAQSKQVAKQNDLGLMTFANVRVVNVAPVATSTTAASQGQVAHIDANKQLGAGTPEQVAALKAAGTARTRQRAATVVSKQSSATLTSLESSGPEDVIGPDSGVGVMLDESSMVFNVAHVDANGKVSEICVDGKDAAHATVHSEVRHDR